MNGLLCSCIVNNESAPLAQFPRELMDDYEVGLVQWVLDYKGKYGSMPEISRVQGAFPYFVPFDERDPVWDVYDQELKRKTIQHLKVGAINALADLEGGSIPEVEIRNLARLLSGYSGTEKFTLFDRSKYFRSNLLKTGINVIDNLTKGIGRGEVLIVSGRLGTGKSTISQYFTYRWWLDGKRIMYASGEMLAEDIFARIDGFANSINPNEFRDESKVTSGDAMLIAKKLESTAKGSGVGEIFVPPPSAKTPSAIFTLAQDFECDVVVVDAFYLLHPDGKSSGGKNWERVLAISNEIKQHARESKLPCVAVTQIKRGAKGLSGGMFDAEDLSFSDAIGQDSDFVVAIKPDDVNPRIIEVQLIKNRFGNQGAQYITLDFDKMQVSNSARVNAYATVGAEEW